VRALPSVAERVRRAALPRFEAWGLWHDGDTAKPEAVRPAAWIVAHAPELYMSMLALLPWASMQSERQFGGFNLLPYGAALASGAIPPGASHGIDLTLTGYGHRRPIDRAHVPILRAAHLGFLDELDDDAVEGYFAFRTQIAFAALSSRDYFGLRYCNSDSVRMDIRSFSEDATDAVRIDRRRRDGYRSVLYSSDTFRERRPDYVDSCALDRDVDTPLLTAFACAGTDTGLWGAVSEAIAGANTDSPAVDAQSELIDAIGAISRLVDEWEGRPHPQGVPHRSRTGAGRRQTGDAEVPAFLRGG